MKRSAKNFRGSGLDKEVVQSKKLSVEEVWIFLEQHFTCAGTVTEELRGKKP